MTLEDLVGGRGRPSDYLELQDELC
jgi:hypothetical protein